MESHKHRFDNRELEFDFGDVVYFKTDPDHDPYMVIGYAIHEESILVLIRNKDAEQSVYEYEIACEKNFGI